MPRPGVKTSEFWLVVLAITLTNLGALDVPEEFRWIVTLGMIVGYAISRGLAKTEDRMEPNPVFPTDLEAGLDPEFSEDIARAEADKPRKAGF